MFSPATSSMGGNGIPFTTMLTLRRTQPLMGMRRSVSGCGEKIGITGNHGVGSTDHSVNITKWNNILIILTLI